MSWKHFFPPLIWPSCSRTCLSGVKGSTVVLSYTGPSFLMHYETERPITHCSHKRPYHGWPEEDKSPTARSENTVGTIAFLESELLLLGIRSTPHVARCREPRFNHIVMLITDTSKQHDRADATWSQRGTHLSPKHGFLRKSGLIVQINLWASTGY